MTVPYKVHINNSQCTVKLQKTLQGNLQNTILVKNNQCFTVSNGNKGVIDSPWRVIPITIYFDYTFVLG